MFIIGFYFGVKIFSCENKKKHLKTLPRKCARSLSADFLFVRRRDERAQCSSFFMEHLYLSSCIHPKTKKPYKVLSSLHKYVYTVYWMQTITKYRTLYGKLKGWSWNSFNLKFKNYFCQMKQDIWQFLPVKHVYKIVKN